MSADAVAFLSDLQLRKLTTKLPVGLDAVALYIGVGHAAFAVAVISAPAVPPAATLRGVWKARHGGRPAPLLVVALYGSEATLCGPAGEEPPVYASVDAYIG